jgi:hypothetical protein
MPNRADEDGCMQIARLEQIAHVCRYTGGHFDHYVGDYSDWQAGGLDESVFDKPPNCKPEGVEIMARRPGLDLRTELLTLLPPVYHGAVDTGVTLKTYHVGSLPDHKLQQPAAGSSC